MLSALASSRLLLTSRDDAALKVWSTFVENAELVREIDGWSEQLCWQPPGLVLAPEQARHWCRQLQLVLDESCGCGALAAELPRRLSLMVMTAALLVHAANFSSCVAIGMPGLAADAHKRMCELLGDAFNLVPHMRGKLQVALQQDQAHLLAVGRVLQQSLAPCAVWVR